MKFSFDFGGPKTPKTPSKPKVVREKVGEYKASHYSRADKKNPIEHDPYANPLEGVYNNPAADVIDPENYFNEPGFEDYKIRDEVIDESTPEGEIEEMMSKYGLEEWELAGLMRQCEESLNTRKRAPLADKEAVRELASFYRDYLRTKNEYGLPFSEEELARLPEGKAERLADIYENEITLKMKIAELNTGHKPEDNKFVYSTARQADAPIHFNKLAQELYLLRKEADEIKDVMDYQPTEKKQKDKNDKSVWADVPKYSKEELALREECLSYFSDRRNPRPVFADGQKLSHDQILEVVREKALDERWPIAAFKENVYQGVRQLAAYERTRDGKTIKYICRSKNLPAGRYFFKFDISKLQISRNNSDFAIVPIDLILSTEAAQTEDRIRKVAG